MVFLTFETIGNAQNFQTNILIAVLILGSYLMIKDSKEIISILLTLTGVFIKIYGIVSLAFFFFVKNKKIYILSFIVGLILFYLAPLVITNINFINQSYIHWLTELKAKNLTNIDLNNTHQNMSAIGIVMKVIGNNTFNILYILIPACLLQGLPLLKISSYKNELFQLRYLCTVLLFVILYSTGTEASTHIIGALGVGIWWLSSENYNQKSMLIFIGFCFILGTLSTTDLFPKDFNFGFIRKYSLNLYPTGWFGLCVSINLFLYLIQNTSL